MDGNELFVLDDLTREEMETLSDALLVYCGVCEFGSPPKGLFAPPSNRFGIAVDLYEAIDAVVDGKSSDSG